MRLPNALSASSGPVSLLVISTSPQLSDLTDTLASKVKTLQSVHNRLSLHVLRLEDANMTGYQNYSNAFLNLARLFAQTTQVALFPGSLSHLPSPHAYSTIQNSRQKEHRISSLSHYRPLLLQTSDVAQSRRRLTTLPVDKLVPIVLHKETAPWCTERFFAAPSRSADWDECLWQMWLDMHGEIDELDVLVDEGDIPMDGGRSRDVFFQGGNVSLDVAARPTSVGTANGVLQTRIHNKLKSKFRTETCILAAKQLADLYYADAAAGGIGKRDITRKIRWLKHTCQEVSAHPTVRAPDTNGFFTNGRRLGCTARTYFPKWVAAIR